MAQTKTGNQNNAINPRMVKVAVRITPETIDELRAMYAHQEQGITIRMVKIGGWRYPCAIHLLPENEVKDFKRLQQNEAKREQRKPDAGSLMGAVVSFAVTQTSISAPNANGGSLSTSTTAIRPVTRLYRNCTKIRRSFTTGLAKRLRR